MLQGRPKSILSSGTWFQSSNIKLGKIEKPKEGTNSVMTTLMMTCLPA